MMGNQRAAVRAWGVGWGEALARCLVVWMLFQIGACEPSAAQRRATTLARPLTRGTAPRLAPSQTLEADPLEPSTSGPVPPTAPAGGIQTCGEPCTDCTVLIESDGPERTPSRTATPSERALLRTVFHAYLQSQECLDDPEHVPLRDLGKRAPDVSRTTFVVDGSFTTVGAQQTLIGLFMGHCGLVGSHAENSGLSVIVVLEPGRLPAVTKKGPTNAIEVTPIDIEKDGIDEIVAVTADYASGSTFSEAEIWSMAEGPRSLAHFDLSLQSCRVGDGTYFESTLLSRWDSVAKRKCFLQRRRDLVCPP